MIILQRGFENSKLWVHISARPPATADYNNITFQLIMEHHMLVMLNLLLEIGVYMLLIQSTGDIDGTKSTFLVAASFAWKRYWSFGGLLYRVARRKRKTLLCSTLQEDEVVAIWEDDDMTDKNIVGVTWGLYYIKPRSMHWWDEFSTVVMQEDPIRFRRMFRVSKQTFQYLCDLLSVDLERHPPHAFTSIPERLLPVNKQVAIALRRLATGDSLLTISELFGVGESTVSKTVRRFIFSMLKRAQHHLQWPSTEEHVDKVKRGFERVGGIPQVCGALDCTHVEVQLPSHGRSSDFFDKDHDYSYILQGIVDSNMRFLDVVAGFPGVVHDQRVLSNSAFFQEVQDGRRLNGSQRRIQGIWIPELIIADSGYTHSEWLLVPYPRRNLHNMYEIYNNTHSSTRIVVERAFGRLKSVWRILFHPICHPDTALVPKLIYVCCLLHNILLDHGDIVDDDVIFPGHHDEGFRRQISHRPVTSEIEMIRVAIMEYLVLRAARAPM